MTRSPFPNRTTPATTQLRPYDLETWSRWPEVVAYAERHQLSYGDAIQSLVNSGLSHWRR